MIALWDERCLDVLRRNEGKYHDHEMAALIEAATGIRFKAKTVQRYRLKAGLAACTRNDWTAPLARCRAYINGRRVKCWEASRTGVAHLILSEVPDER